jgi:hypothetical protein
MNTPLVNLVAGVLLAAGGAMGYLKVRGCVTSKFPPPPPFPVQYLHIKNFVASQNE